VLSFGRQAWCGRATRTVFTLFSRCVATTPGKRAIARAATATAGGGPCLPFSDYERFWTLPAGGGCFLSDAAFCSSPAGTLIYARRCVNMGVVTFAYRCAPWHYGLPWCAVSSTSFTRIIARILCWVRCSTCVRCKTWRLGCRLGRCWALRRSQTITRTFFHISPSYGTKTPWVSHVLGLLC